jgi:hypothetical protein
VLARARVRSGAKLDQTLGVSNTNRFELITQRQRKLRKRDVVFACFIAMLAILGGTTVGFTIHGVMTHVASR